MKQTITCLFVISAILMSGLSVVKAKTSRNINTTVNVGICGDTVRQATEECDTHDLNGKSCESLGFNGGDLSCNMSCNFDIAECEIPQIDSDNVPSNEVDSLAATGDLQISSLGGYSATPTLTSTKNITVKIQENGGQTSVFIPKDVVMSREDDEDIDPTTISVSSIPAASVSGIIDKEVKNTMQWGIPGIALNFSNPITINLFVGPTLQGLTLQVYRSESVTGGWTNEGLVDDSCLVDASGICSFRTLKASYFIATAPSQAPSNNNQSNNQSSSSDSNTTNQSSTGYVSTQKLSIQELNPFTLPDILTSFDLSGSGRLLISDLATVTKIWFDSWKSTILNGIDGTKPLSNNKCDINRDGACNLGDFSVLMYYVGR